MSRTIVIYDKAGNASEMRSVDAKECVESGEYFYQKPVKEKPETKQSKAKLTDG
jgi:hypothetical protein